MKFFLNLLLLLLAIGCSSAPKVSEVKTVYVPASRYENMTCEKLVIEAEAVRRSVPGLEEAVEKHRSNQTGVEVVTWLLFFPAALALDKGEGNSTKLGQAKGELEAISIAMKSNKCG
jgi:hypothetical protein